MSANYLPSWSCAPTTLILPINIPHTYFQIQHTCIKLKCRVWKIKTNSKGACPRNPLARCCGWCLWYRLWHAPVGICLWRAPVGICLWHAPVGISYSIGDPYTGKNSSYMITYSQSCGTEDDKITIAILSYINSNMKPWKTKS